MHAQKKKLDNCDKWFQLHQSIQSLETLAFQWTNADSSGIAAPYFAAFAAGFAAACYLAVSFPMDLQLAVKTQSRQSSHLCTCDGDICKTCC